MLTTFVTLSKAMLTIFVTLSSYAGSIYDTLNCCACVDNLHDTLASNHHLFVQCCPKWYAYARLVRSRPSSELWPTCACFVGHKHVDKELNRYRTERLGGCLGGEILHHDGDTVPSGLILCRVAQHTIPLYNQTGGENLAWSINE